MENHFIYADKNQYDRDIDVIANYVNDASLYLHKSTGKGLEICREFVERQISESGKHPLKDPEVLILAKDKPGNREQQVVLYSDYLKEISENNRLFSPTLAVYHNYEQLPSLAGDFIDINIAKRSKSKKEKMAAKEQGNKELEIFKENEQSSFKIFNNALSGAQASNGTVLYNKTAHSSLTSTCRTATSYGNANNEKFLFGNRHYWNPEIVRANIISIIGHTDYNALKETMDYYQLNYPTVEQTMEVITYSTSLYWDNLEEMQSIVRLVNKLTDIERAAFVYTGDLYHLAKFNDSVVREFLTKLSAKARIPVENPDFYINQMDGDLVAFVSSICEEELGESRTIRKLKIDNPAKYALVGATAKSVMETLDEYKLLITSLWRTKNIPASVANIRDSRRRGVITSDTDSTIFTVQSWVEWYTGKIDLSDISKAISYTVVYLATQTIAHILAIVSGAMGVEKKHIHRLAMKNEYFFPVFSLTNMAKHYYAYRSAQEGVVLDKLETEVKGIYLKDSNCPKAIMKEFHNTLRGVMDDVMLGRKIKAGELIDKIAGIEKGILDSVKSGKSEYLSRAQVKDKSSYANPQVSNYAHYGLWNEVFGPKYGIVEEPPYMAIKASVSLDSKTKLEDWFELIEDKALVERMRNWMLVNRKVGFTSLVLPRAIIEANGMPLEVIHAMNIRKLIYLTVRPFYILLESLGLFYINDDITKLVSDFY